jgi:hypothetical protein
MGARDDGDKYPDARTLATYVLLVVVLLLIWWLESG